jgi:hypothetical protein
MPDINEKIRISEGVFEEVYGDNLEKPIDNDIRYSNWKSYGTQPIEIEKNLGSTFEAKTNEEYRLKRLQDQVAIPKNIRKQLEYEEKTGILKQFLNENHLKDVYFLAGQMKEYIKEKELLPTILALYEVKLFIETKQVLNDLVLRKIIQEYYYSNRKTSFRKNKGEYKSATIIFFHVIGKILRDLYTGQGRIFSYTTPLIQRLSEVVKQKIDSYLIETQEFGFLEGKNISEKHYESYKQMSVPRIFTKILLVLHVNKQFQEIAIQISTKKLHSTLITLEKLKILSKTFKEKYLNSDKWIKTSHGIALTLLKDLEPELVKQILEETEVDNFYMTYHNIKNRHGELFREVFGLIKRLEKMGFV